jgi:putative transposase
MLVSKSYKFRIYPNKEQVVLIAKTIGCYRLVFNHFLVKWNEELHKGLTYHACSSQSSAIKERILVVKRSL